MGVAALSGPVDAQRLEAGLEELRELGFEPVTASNLRLRRGLFAGHEEERLAGFHQLVRDPSVEAVIFARGGHGVLGLLPKIDWEALQQVPRAYVGYSDATPLLLEISRRLALTTFHGPMVGVELARGLLTEERGSLLKALEGRFPAPLPIRCLSAPSGLGPIEAPLTGGCLTMLTATLGTEFRPRLEGAVVFLEDTGEPLYRRERMLTQLRLAGCFEGVRALVFGHFTGLQEERDEDAAAWREMLIELGEREGLAVGDRLEVGHRAPNLTLPIGRRARLDLAKEQLIILEATTRASGVVV